MFYLFFLFGLLIRLALVPIPGFKADVAFWKGWGLAVADKGILWLVNYTNYNYPPGFAYILWVVNKFYALFKNPYNLNEYWADNNYFYLFLIKIITIVADLLIVFLILKIGQLILTNGLPRIASGLPQKENQWKSVSHPWQSNLVKILALFYFLNPAVIYDGVVWGQVDQFGLALFLLSIYLVFKGKSSWGSAIFTISCLMKFQNIIFIPLFYLFIWRKFSFKEMVRSLGITVITFIIVIFPFFLGKQMEKLIWLLTVNSDWFPWYSLNAFNGWWILSGLKGMQLTDKHLVFGIISAKQVGLYLFSFTYSICMLTLLLAKRENLLRNFILACTLAVFAFFHLLTQSHERYLFPVMGLLPILIIYSKATSFRRNEVTEKSSGALFYSRQRRDRFLAIAESDSAIARNDKWLEFIFYLLVSIFFFLNMYLSMGWNYPDQVIPAFTKDQTLGLSLWISIIQIVLFTIFIYRFMRLSLMGHIRLIGVMGIILMVGLFLKNSDYFMRKPVSLTLLKPVGYHQDYLEPIYNRTVESGRGAKFWNRLSVNYFFYDKGIGSHADSEISYHLAKKFSSFSSDFGLDTEADQSAKVYFSILADGKELFKSGVKGRFDPPGRTEINIRGVKYLTLKISKAGESNFGAHADWLNPVLLR